MRKKVLFLLMLMFFSLSLLHAQNDGEDTLGIHPWKEIYPMTDSHKLAHWSIDFEAGMNINNIDFSSTGLDIVPSSRIRPAGGVSFEYDFTPVWGLAASYSYANYGAQYNGLTGMEYATYGHVHNAQLLLTIDLIDAFARNRRSTIFSTYLLLGGGAGFYRSESMISGALVPSREDGKYSPTGLASVGLLFEFNLSREAALGLQGMYSIYTSNLLDASQTKCMNFMEYATLNFRWKINGMPKNHVRNYSPSEWRMRDKSEEERIANQQASRLSEKNKKERIKESRVSGKSQVYQGTKDTIVIKDTTIITIIDTIYAIDKSNSSEAARLSALLDSIEQIAREAAANAAAAQAAADKAAKEAANKAAAAERAAKLASEKSTKSTLKTSDSDGDGVPDVHDLCPDTPIEAYGLVDKFGCPLDSDHDGIPDYLDECPDTPEEGRYAVDATGCLRDRDGDGVPDYIDQCPTVPGSASNNGCPEVKREVRNLLTKAMQGIQFETGKSTIKASSYPLLNQIANAFISEPNWRVEVQGHTDNVGKAETNQKLSEARANAVRNYLIKAGVPATQLIAHGYGMSMPMADNSTAEGRALNRRVEFVITFEEISYETK